MHKFKIQLTGWEFQLLDILMNNQLFLNDWFTSWTLGLMSLLLIS